MKQVLAAVLIALGLSLTINTAYAEEHEVKQVCKDKVGKDGQPQKGKDGKVQQECRNVKIHKKLEGHEVPTKK